jgi:hypothetical protein
MYLLSKEIFSLPEKCAVTKCIIVFNSTYIADCKDFNHTYGLIKKTYYALN